MIMKQACIDRICQENVLRHNRNSLLSIVLSQTLNIIYINMQIGLSNERLQTTPALEYIRQHEYRFSTHYLADQALLTHGQNMNCHYL